DHQRADVLRKHQVIADGERDGPDVGIEQTQGLTRHKAAIVVGPQVDFAIAPHQVTVGRHEYRTVVEAAVGSLWQAAGNVDVVGSGDLPECARRGARNGLRQRVQVVADEVAG